VTSPERSPRVVYYDHDAPDPQPGFRSGEAGFVIPARDGTFETDVQVRLPANALHALEQHGVVDQLRRLPFAIGPIEPGRDAVVRPSALDACAEIFWAADRKTYGRTWEFVIGTDAGREPTEHRIVIDNRGYQRSLSQLQFLVSRASREGSSVRLRL